MRLLLISLILFPLVANSQLLNEALLVENYYNHNLHIDNQGEISLTYMRLWMSGPPGSEPNIDSTKMYFTFLDSLARPSGELWSFTNSTAGNRYRPLIVGNEENLSLLYTHVGRQDSSWVTSYRSQQVNGPEFPQGDELILIDSSTGPFSWNTLELSVDQFMYYGSGTNNLGQSGIYGQRFNADELIGESFQIYHLEPEDTSIFIQSSKRLDTHNSVAGLSLILWAEESIVLPNFTEIGRLKILRLGTDGLPLEEPQTFRTISGDLWVDIDPEDVFLQNDGTIILSYRTTVDTLDSESWLHSISNYGEMGEMEQIYQIQTDTPYTSTYFPPEGAGVIYYCNDDSVIVQRISPRGDLLGQEEALPFRLNLSCSSLQCVMHDGKLIMFENGIYSELYSHVCLWDNSVSVNLDQRLQPIEPLLRSAYPNPFNPSTTIEYDLPEMSEVSLIIYDVVGREVKTHVIQSQAPGVYRVSWDGTNQDGHQVAGGMYFARLQAGEYSSVVKMVYLR